jgi:hypothetical protein
MRRTFKPTLLSLPTAILLLGIAVSAQADEAPSERLPVPNSSVQTPVFNRIRAQYKDDYAKRTAADQLALAEEFRKQAVASGLDTLKQYVLLREARELAVNAGDMDEAFAIIDLTARLFTIDPNELKSTAVANAMDRALIPEPQLMENYLKVCDDAIYRGDLQLAVQSSNLAFKLARLSHDPATIARAKQMDLRVHDLRRETTDAIAAANKLQANMEDPALSLIVGRYLCYRRGMWDAGLPVLSKCSDKRLHDLAGKDTDGPPTAASMADLADGWWDVPDTQQMPQRRSRERAVYWYAKALPDLTGERKTLCEKRIAEVKAGPAR